MKLQLCSFIGNNKCQLYSSGGIDVKVKHLLLVVLRKTLVMDLADTPFTEHSHVPDVVLSLANNHSLGHEYITCEHMCVHMCICVFTLLILFLKRKKKKQLMQKGMEDRQGE